MTAQAGPIAVALGFDRAYAPHAAALIASLIRTAPANTPFEFIVLHAEVDPALQARIASAAPNARFLWCEIGADEIPAMASREHFSRAILFRLGLARHAPAEWRRVLYLDVDAIVLTDVTELWGADLGGAVLGAVADCYMDPQKFAARWGLQGESPGYFNSGVLLFDLERMRAGKLFEKAVAFVVANLDDVRFTDQDALNFACWSQWKRLDARWNVQRHMVISALNEETPPDRRLNGQSPAIIHYTSAEKPWLSEGYHPWAWAYWDNLQRTQFLKDVRTRYRVGLLHLFRMWARWVWRGPKQS